MPASSTCWAACRRTSLPAIAETIERRVDQAADGRPRAADRAGRSARRRQVHARPHAGRAGSACPFIELDRMVEQEYGASVPLLIEMSGLATFRRHERICLERVVAENEAAVITTAGGIVSNPETYGLLLRRAHSVWISARPEEHMSRVIKQGDFRPMAHNREAMADLLGDPGGAPGRLRARGGVARHLGRERAAELRQAAEDRRALDEGVDRHGRGGTQARERQGPDRFQDRSVALSPLEALGRRRGRHAHRWTWTRTRRCSRAISSSSTPTISASTSSWPTRWSGCASSIRRCA